MTCKIVPDMTYYVSSGMLNPTILTYFGYLRTFIMLSIDFSNAVHGLCSFDAVTASLYSFLFVCIDLCGQ